MNLKLKARWRLFRYHREMSKLDRRITVLQRLCYDFRRKHCLDKDSTKRLLAPPHSYTMDMMLAKDREMCDKLDWLIATIRVFRKEHNI